MAADKRRPESDPHDQDLIDDLTERVFKDYEPPKPEPSGETDEGDDAAEELAAA